MQLHGHALYSSGGWYEPGSGQSSITILCDAKESTDKPLPDDIGNSGGASCYSELCKNITEMTIDGTWTNEECSRNLLVSVTLCYQMQDFEFSLGEGEIKIAHGRDSSPRDSAWFLLASMGKLSRR